MLKLPNQLSDRHTSLLKRRGAPPAQHRYYIKWLGYYLDFCHKYNFDDSAPESLPAFLKKLKEKKQAEKLRGQAHQAISRYRELETAGDKTTQRNLVRKKNPTKVNPPSTPSSPIKETAFNQTVCEEIRNKPNQGKSEVQLVSNVEAEGADGTEILNELRNCIKLRHYSPRTLKTFTSWTRKFQTFLKSKDPQLIEGQDVKDFLIWLAVDHKRSNCLAGNKGIVRNLPDASVQALFCRD